MQTGKDETMASIGRTARRVALATIISGASLGASLHGNLGHAYAKAKVASCSSFRTDTGYSGNITTVLHICTSGAAVMSVDTYYTNPNTVPNLSSMRLWPKLFIHTGSNSWQQWSSNGPSTYGATSWSTGYMDINRCATGHGDGSMVDAAENVQDGPAHAPQNGDDGPCVQQM